MANPDPDTRGTREGFTAPLLGIALVVIFALALVFWWMMGKTAEAPAAAGTTTIEQTDVEVVAPATDAPDAAKPDAVAPAPAPAPAPEATGDKTGTTAP